MTSFPDQPVDGNRAEPAVGGVRAQRAALTRARLVEAAKVVFAEQGLPDARIADITKRAGVSYGSFYHHFESKEALFREITEQVGDLLHAPVEEVILKRGSPTLPQERLRQSLRLYFESYRQEAPFLGVIEQAARVDSELRAARYQQDDRHNKEVADSIRQLQQRGLADPTIDPAVAAWALGGMTSRFAELWLAQGRREWDFDLAVDSIIRLFINALGLDNAHSSSDQRTAGVGESRPTRSRRPSRPLES